MNQQKMNIITNSVFVDSSVIIEYFKGTKTELLTALLDKDDIQLVVSEIVLSEITFHFLAFKAKKSPLSVKTSKKISDFLPDIILSNIISELHLIGIENKEKFQYLQFMSDYNLLSSDALILSTCKQNAIKYLASYDSDFKIPCLKEGVVLLNQDTDFAQFI